MKHHTYGQTRQTTPTHDFFERDIPAQLLFAVSTKACVCVYTLRDVCSVRPRRDSMETTVEQQPFRFTSVDTENRLY